MIAKSAPKRVSGRGSFVDLQRYLERDDLGRRRDDLVASWSRGVVLHETAGLEMEQTALLARHRQTDPVYHIIASWRPGDTVTVEQAKAAEDALLRSIGAQEHQSFTALHYDADTDRYHLHIGVNKIGPEAHRVLRTWNDFAKLAGASEYLERQYGFTVDRKMDWRKKVGERDFGLERDDEMQKIARGLDMERTGTIAARDARHAMHYSWTEIMAREVSPAVALTLENAAARWRDVHAAVRPYGVRFEEAGSGFRIVGPERGQHVKASAIGIDAKALRERLGAFQEVLEHLPFDDRLGIVREPAKRWQTWAEAHEDLRQVDLAIKDMGGGRGQVIDLTGDGKVACEAVTGSLRGLEARLGAYQTSPALAERDATEAQRRAQGLKAKAAIIAADPDLVLGPMSNLRSTWERADVEREVRSKLSIASDADAPVVARATDAVLEQCVTLDAERGLYSTAELVAEERALFAAAHTLADRRKSPSIREPGAELDAQQREAYEHLAQATQLAIVTGIAGAGKSRLTRDYAAANEEAGYRVIGVAVAGEAARTLGEEAQIQSRTVAKLLAELGDGRERLDERTVLLIDEAGTIGTAQAQALFERARDARATVRLLGDAEQHESVARGAVLRGLCDDLGSYDMTGTRRANHDWLRDVARDLRANRVGPALDNLRQHGCILGYQTTDEAREHLVERYVAAHNAGGSAILLADKNADMHEMNRLVQERLRDRLGEGHIYATAFGERTFAIGDLLIGREGAYGGVNGDRYTLAGHRDDGRMQLVRQRDGASVRWDTHEHSAIDLGYAITSYRSQSKTVDDVLVLASDGRRGNYVDVTRARDTVTIAYGRDQIRDFGELMHRAQRDGSKTLVRDAERIVAQRVAAEQRKAFEQTVEWKQSQAPKIDPPTRSRGMRR